jgi:dTDP-glucose 4,6-dehydratase
MSDLHRGVSKTIVITGGCGFIGSAVLRQLLKETDFRIVNVDALTYAADRSFKIDSKRAHRYFFVHADISNKEAVREVFLRFRPAALINLAAETHVDRSIDSPESFFSTNLYGVFNLLEAAREYSRESPTFRFHHVSTDEVFGSLDPSGPSFTENTRYEPSSPYSATKAGADHLVRAWGKTYGMDVVVTGCCNNFGPYQFPEKLIPLMILNAIAGKPLPLYGNGQQVREWLYVEDHARALLTVLLKGLPGETYNIGSREERSNIQVVRSICGLLEKIVPDLRSSNRYEDQITYVNDRPAHDQRYAIDSSKIRTALGWEPTETFDTGLEKTVLWYLANTSWWETLSTRYRQERLGILR